MGKEIRLSAVYKSPATSLLTDDIDLLLNSDVSTLIAGDLNAKNPIWNSNSTNSAGKTLQNHMERHLYTIVSPDSPTHFPDIHYHSPDVFDVAIIKSDILQYEIDNLDKLSSDHNPILIDFSSRTSSTGEFMRKKHLTNW